MMEKSRLNAQPDPEQVKTSSKEQVNFDRMQGSSRNDEADFGQRQPRAAISISGGCPGLRGGTRK
jgi:hypothetical protein